MARPLVLSALLAILTSACGAAYAARMPRRSVMWVDQDRTPFGPRPPERYVSWRGDAIDHLMLRPASEVWTFPVARPAVNVNALDEVPDSSWYENRGPLAPEDVARAACPTVALDAPTPWRVVGGKPNGSHPGLTVEDARGVRYLLKTDGELQPERATAADAIGAALFWAAGYQTPCNRVGWVGRDDLVLDEDADVSLSSGATRPLVAADIDVVLESAMRGEDGRYRVGLSRFFEGVPLGPWSYEGTREEDPNDVVPHEDRRDVRGLYLMSAWTGHIDVRQENTLALWREVGDGRGWVEHALVDFGDCFGVTIASARMSRRFEHDHYLNLGNVLIDAATLGVIDRRWQHGDGEVRDTLGFFDAERFTPDEWAPGYPNPAFDARTPHDDAWMARVLARLSPAHVRAAVSVGHLSEPARARLVEVLLARREAILERYLTRLSPLAAPTRRGGAICFEDLTVTAGLREARSRRYRARTVMSAPPTRPAPLEVTPGPCVRWPDGLEYLAFDVLAEDASPGDSNAHPLRVHAYDGEVVGLDRFREGFGAP